MMNTSGSARQPSRQWSVLLMAPAAWLSALGILFTLSEDACTSDARQPLWALITICIVAALISAPLAWRARSLPETVSGLSAILSAVLMLVAVPVLLFDSCRP